MTASSRRPSAVGYPAGPQPRAFAHRGWHVEELAGLENTAAAFERAVAEGYHYLETDVHLTADGVLVAFHDSSLDRVTGRHGRIADLPWREVQAARIGDREPIPLLADLLHDFPTACFNIDAKSDAAVVPLADAIRAAGAEHRVCVASFSDRRLARLRAATGPAVASSLGPRSVVGLVARSRRVPVPARTSGATAVQVPVRSSGVAVTTRAFVEAAHHRHLEVHVWTIDDPVEMTRLLELGVDGIMTDRPDLLREVLRQRGAWAD